MGINLRVRSSCEKIRVLAIGPAEGVVTGQSLAFSTYTRKSRHEISVANTNGEGMVALARAGATLRTIAQTAWRLFTRKPNCVYITTSRSKLGAIKDIVVIALARTRGVPIVNHLHGGAFLNFHESLGPIYGRVVDWAYRQIDVSIVLHQKFTSQYTHYPRMKVEVVNNFVSSELSMTFLAEKFMNGPVNVLFLSNVFPEKGIFELVNAIKNVLRKHPATVNLKIAGRVFAGSGMSSSEVETKLLGSITGISEIEYCGVADMAAKQCLLEWAHVFVLPSYMNGEAVPLALLEAMAAGCYLIVSDYGILSDLVDNLVGVVVPTRDVGAIEKALIAIVLNRESLLESQSNNPLVAREIYSEEQYISSIDRVIEAYSRDRIR